jgi:hypothetical protein
MAIYVDDFKGRFRGMVMSHMMSDVSTDELKTFAISIGLKIEWFQSGVVSGSMPHFDVSQSMKKKAIKAGAIPIKCSDKIWMKIVTDWKTAKNERLKKYAESL